MKTRRQKMEGALQRRRHDLGQYSRWLVEAQADVLAGKREEQSRVAELESRRSRALFDVQNLSLKLGVSFSS